MSIYKAYKIISKLKWNQGIIRSENDKNFIHLSEINQLPVFKNIEEYKILEIDLNKSSIVKWELNKGKQYPHIYYPYLIKIINVFDLEEIINRKDFNYLKNGKTDKNEFDGKKVFSVWESPDGVEYVHQNHLFADHKLAIDKAESDFIKKFGEILKQTKLKEDGQTDAYRFFGSEFALIAKDSTYEDAINFSKQLQKSFEEFFYDLNGRTCECITSMFFVVKK